MGTHDHPSAYGEEAALRNGPEILVVASPAWLDALAAAGPAIPRLETLPLDRAAPVPAARLARAAMLVIEVDPEDRASMQRIGHIRESRPNMPLVAAINGASVSLVRTLVRQGISDVVSLPFDPGELLQATLDAAATRESKPAAAPRALAPLVAVARALGGSGATSIATQLAADLAANDTSGRGVVIADLDLQFGSVADYLGVRPRGSLTDLLDAPDRLDEELLRSIAAEADGGVSVIAAPDAIMPLEAVDVDGMLAAIKLLRQQYGYVVLDLPANWTNWTLSAALAADSLVLVVELTIASLRQAKRRLELFRSVGIENRNIQIVVNRVEKRLFRTIDLDDVERTLGHPALGSVALESPALDAAQTQGRLVSELHRKSRFAADVARIGGLLRAGPLARGA